MKEESKQFSRINSLDLLRGIAVVLMVQQHTGYWFWNAGGHMESLMPKFPVMVTVNGLGGLAAPLFILLAGTGTSLAYTGGKSGKQIFQRGCMIMLFGFILNLLTPAWFAPWSWYVLHLIGFGMCISPLLRKRSASLLFGFTIIITVLTVVLLDLFSMTRYFSNEDMRGALSAGSIIKLALFAGNFPLFPWLALFITGFISGRWISDQKFLNILKTAAVILLSGILLFIIKQGNFSFFNNGFGKKLLIINLYMYPAYPMQFLALSAVSLLSVYAVIYTGKKLNISADNILVLTGRVSLTVFILHIVIIRNFMIKSGLWQTFSEMHTILLQLTLLILIMLLVYFWHRKNFRYGFEWILRFF